jgi:hypothetical protein
MVVEEVGVDADAVAGGELRRRDFADGEGPFVLDVFGCDT